MSKSSVPAGKEAHVKGAALQDFLGWYAGEHGAARMAAIWEKLSAPAKAELGPSHEKLLPFHWYDAAAISELMDRVVEGHSDAERDHMARQGAKIVISRTLRGLYKAIFNAIMTPDRYIRNAHRVWGSFHDTGAVEGVEIGPGHHRTEIHGWRSHHPFIELLNGYAGQEIYLAMGCKNVRFNQTRRADARGTVFTTEVFFDP